MYGHNGFVDVQTGFGNIDVWFGINNKLALGEKFEFHGAG